MLLHTFTLGSFVSHRDSLVYIHHPCIYIHSRLTAVYNQTTCLHLLDSASRRMVNTYTPRSRQSIEKGGIKHQRHKHLNTILNYNIFCKNIQLYCCHKSFIRSPTYCCMFGFFKIALIWWLENSFQPSKYRPKRAITRGVDKHASINLLISAGIQIFIYPKKYVY